MESYKLHLNCKKNKSNVALHEGKVQAYLIISTINHMTVPTLKIDLEMKISLSFELSFTTLIFTRKSSSNYPIYEKHDYIDTE